MTQDAITIANRILEGAWGYDDKLVKWAHYVLSKPEELARQWRYDYTTKQWSVSDDA